jgi:hypothetical protein
VIVRRLSSGCICKARLNVNLGVMTDEDFSISKLHLASGSHLREVDRSVTEQGNMWHSSQEEGLKAASL